ncbi:hypothetical protein BG011_007493 [Mortierella polycephala]|uniref:NudC domain-containing protein 1 n=1 Tax=Mortierella polycephala TaxID=41804 RepID=A0A9P6QBE8_9FUNG|nr:hypothetical protein BG011_007493 [Mortierella polycephala]
MAIRIPIQQDRSLLNAKFEGYKLSFLDESRQHFVPVGAPGPGIVIPKLPLSAKLSYREVQARVRHNHLHPGWNSLKTSNGDSSSIRDGILFAIDENFTLTSLQFDKTTRRLRSKKLIQIPPPAVPLNFHLEFPSVKPISPDYILVSDGASAFYLIRLILTGMEPEAVIEATTRFRPEEALQDDESVPCGLMEAKAFPISNSESGHGFEVKFVVHHTHKGAFYSSEPSPHHKSDRKTVFIVSLCSIIWDRSPIGSTGSANADTDMEIETDGTFNNANQRQPTTLPISVIHSIRGTEIPCYCAFDPSSEGYVIGSNTTFKPTKEPVVDQTSQSLEPGSTAMELDGTSVGEKSSSEPPYIWNQTETDITICFSLPKGTTKHAIQCKFSRQDIQLQVNLSQSTEQMVRAPQLDNMPLFDQINPDDCFWTLESAIGVLTLSLEKKHAKTRWTQVFAEDVDTTPVEETVDPSVFAEYKAALEKYTSEQANAGPGRESTIYPSIAQDAQEDIDEEGEEIKFSWIQAIEGADIVRATTIGTGHDWIGQAFPSFEQYQDVDEPFRKPTVCLKHDVDGLVYSIQHTPGSVPSLSTVQRADGIMKFMHVSTFDALAFVQASKREKRFVMHDPQGRFAVIVESSRNVYIYWHTADMKLKQERQTVVDVSKGQQVDIIGCQLIGDGVLVILMEGKHGAVVLELNQS